MINSDELQFFQLIASHPSLAATARALNVTPPTVTQRLQLIEQKLKVKLVERHARHISLTDEGLLLAERATLILAELDDLHESLASHQNEMSGCLRILAPLSFGHQYIAHLVTQFQTLHPNITVELELSDIPNWSAGQSWDIMIYIGELRDSSLKLAKLTDNRRFLCASPSYITKYGLPKNPEDLRQHHCIVLRENAEDVTMWRFNAKAGDKAHAIRIKPKLASNFGGVTKEWAMQGFGILLRSEWDVAREIKQGKLVRILADYELPSADIVALLGTDSRARSARTTQFLTLLKETIALQPWNR